MPDGALILDRAYCDSAEWRNQARDANGFGRGAAWVDLLAITNQKATEFQSRGIRKPVERGQCAWSKLALAERWGWGQGKVASCLTHWEKIGRITLESGNDGTIITVLNYDNYQTGMFRQLVEQTVSKSGADREQTVEQIVTEKREERRDYRGTDREKGEERREGTAPPVTGLAVVIPSDEEIRSFCTAWTGDMVRGIPAGIPEVWWSGWVSNRLQNEKNWPRDWQRVLVLAFRGDFLARHPKALGHLNADGGPRPAATAATGTNGLSANVTAIQAQAARRKLTQEIAALEDDIYRDRVGNLPRDAAKATLLKKLRGELAALPSEASVQTPGGGA